MPICSRLGDCPSGVTLLGGAVTIWHHAEHQLEESEWDKLCGEFTALRGRRPIKEKCRGKEAKEGARTLHEGAGGWRANPPDVFSGLSCAPTAQSNPDLVQSWTEPSGSGAQVHKLPAPLDASCRSWVPGLLILLLTSDVVGGFL